MLHFSDLRRATRPDRRPQTGSRTGHGGLASRDGRRATRSTRRSSALGDISVVWTVASTMIMAPRPNTNSIIVANTTSGGPLPVKEASTCHALAGSIATSLAVHASIPCPSDAIRKLEPIPEQASKMPADGDTKKNVSTDWNSKLQ